MAPVSFLTFHQSLPSSRTDQSRSIAIFTATVISGVYSDLCLSVYCVVSYVLRSLITNGAK